MASIGPGPSPFLEDPAVKRVASYSVGAPVAGGKLCRLPARTFTPLARPFRRPGVPRLRGSPGAHEGEVQST